METKKELLWFENSELQKYSINFQQLMQSIANQIKKAQKKNKHDKKYKKAYGNDIFRTHQLRTPRLSSRNNAKDKYLCNRIETQLVVKRKDLELPCLNHCSSSKQYLNDSPRVFIKRSFKDPSQKLKNTEKSSNNNSYRLKYTMRKDSIIKEEKNGRQNCKLKINCKISKKSQTKSTECSNIYKLCPWQISDLLPNHLQQQL